MWGFRTNQLEIMMTDKNYAYCCLGVKAEIEGAFEGNSPKRVDPHAGYYASRNDSEEVQAQQAFFTYLNDAVGLDFSQIALIIERFAGSPEDVLASVDWIHKMSSDERQAWEDALSSGNYKQERGRLRTKID